MFYGPVFYKISLVCFILFFNVILFDISFY